MKRESRNAGGRYRVWLVSYRDWQPGSYVDVPPEAVALEPAEEATMSARRAARYVEAFNRAASERGRGVWAVAIPVGSRYEGEPRPGQPVPLQKRGSRDGPAGHSATPTLAHGVPRRGGRGTDQATPSSSATGCQGLTQSPQRSR